MTEPGLIAFERLFEKRLRAALEARNLAVGASLDDNIQTYAKLGREALPDVLKEALWDMFGGAGLPLDRAGDAVFLFIKFVCSLRRTPQERFWFNDYMFNILTGEEILDPLRAFVTDKEFSKRFIADNAGADLAVPTLAILENPASVDDYAFPDTCVVKPTHSSREIIVKTPDRPFDRQIVRDWFRHSYYERTREANYKALQPKVIVEPLLFDGEDIFDLNVFCFEGEPRMVRLTTDALTALRQTCLSLDWQPLDIRRPKYPPQEEIPEAPACLEEIKRVAARLAARFSLIRIDFLVRGARFYVGEITNVSGGAVGRYLDDGEREMSLQIFGPRALEPATPRTVSA
jgi:hypothetical protein